MSRVASLSYSVTVVGSLPTNRGPESRNPGNDESQDMKAIVLTTELSFAEESVIRSFDGVGCNEQMPTKIRDAI